MNTLRRRYALLCLCAAGLGLLGAAPAQAQSAKPPILIGISAEYGVKGSHAAQSIERGVRVAVEEINAAGGLLGGRMLRVQATDDRGVPARGVDNLRELVKQPDLAAVFCGRYSPVALEMVPVANQLPMVLLDPWAAADGIANNGANPNYVFRLSLTDSWAMDALLRHALARKLEKVAVLLPNTAWGRSNEAALKQFVHANARLKPDLYWYNWGDTDFAEKLARARNQGMEALIMVANESEGVHIVQRMAELPAAQRVPIIAHWGIAGGNFVQSAGPALNQVDLVVVQTFSFNRAQGKKVAQVAERYRALFDAPITELLAQVGFAHAYDLTHLLARAIALAGTTKPQSVRDKLEHLPPHDGLVRRYERAFKPGDHEALDRDQVFLGRFLANGTLEPVK